MMSGASTCLPYERALISTQEKIAERIYVETLGCLKPFGLM